MILTLLKTFQLCKELWMWREKNPDKEKDDWPEWEKHGRLESLCPCCEYVKQTRKTAGSCREICPLKFIWNGCVNDKHSPFLPWYYRSSYSDKQRIGGARKIWKACDKEIKRLKKKRR